VYTHLDFSSIRCWPTDQRNKTTCFCSFFVSYQNSLAKYEWQKQGAQVAQIVVAVAVLSERWADSGEGRQGCCGSIGAVLPGR
jgi:hypothetical protein